MYHYTQWRNVEGRSSLVLELYICIRGGKAYEWFVSHQPTVTDGRTKSQKEGSILARKPPRLRCFFLAPVYWYLLKKGQSNS